MVKSELEKLTDCEIAIACHCNFSSTANPQPPNTASHCLPYKCMKAPPGQCNSQTSRDELIVVVVTTHLNSAVSFSSITLKQLGVRQQLQLGRSRVVFCTEISSEVELQYVSELMKSAHVIHFLSSSHSHLAWRSQPSKSQSHWGENHRQKCIQIKSSHQPISSHSSLYQVSPTSTPSSPSLCFHFRHLRHLSTSPKPSAAPPSWPFWRSPCAPRRPQSPASTAPSEEGRPRNRWIWPVRTAALWGEILWSETLKKKTHGKNWERWNKQLVDKIPRLWDTIGKKEQEKRFVEYKYIISTFKLCTHEVFES